MEMFTLELERTVPPTLRANGELDMATAGLLRTALHDALADSPGLVLDMAGVTFIDAVGLRVILDAAASLDGEQPLLVVGSRQLERLLELAGLHRPPSIMLIEK
jgi:anti-anti-sigma factor